MNTATPLLPLADRDLRQRQIVPPEKIASCCALVIGVGAIGRQVAVQLAAMGIPKLELIDPDVVSVVNLAPQAYFQEDLGQAKVHACAAVCRQLNPALDVASYAQSFTRASVKHLRAFETSSDLACFCCVDSITVRRIVWEAVKNHCAFFADGRMAAEVVRVLSCQRPCRDDYYPTTLFDAAQAYAGSCTARSTVYSATIAAGLMLAQFTRWLRGMESDHDVSLNLLSMELSCI